MTGPVKTSRSSGLPTFSLDAFSTSRFVKSSYTARCTYARLQAEHFCPLNPNADRMTPSVATSRSAFAETMAGFLPPISQMAGFG